MAISPLAAHSAHALKIRAATHRDAAAWYRSDARRQSVPSARRHALLMARWHMRIHWRCREVPEW